MSGSERESNPPDGEEQGSKKRDPELENTMPDGGPDLPDESGEEAGGGDDGEVEVKPQL
ncbi:MAG: hypothetical protein GWN07_34490, partial [Actinobacteria bacterium]|nr:hypothetical protein [Actinomycetota bacterium]NIU70472.1 hypothetical protein [Actinomycetota bacterium]NIX24639.1 hypothetical protein [Actinomycetota bacterium]